jgi:hypothetical protein
VTYEIALRPCPRCRSPVYLRCPEGRRFLSFAMCLHPSLVTDMHGVVKVREDTAG